MLAFTLPTSVLRGRFCIRPEADQALINNPVFVQLLPLLSPVLPVQLDENEATRGLDHQALHASLLSCLPLTMYLTVYSTTRRARRRPAA